MNNNTVRTTARTSCLAAAVLLLLLCCHTVALQAQRNDNYRGLLRNQKVKIDATDLPIVFINVNGATIQRNSYVLARMKIIDNSPAGPNHGDTIVYPGQMVDYEGWIALKYRGNSSFDSSDKKPMAFHTLASKVLPDNGLITSAGGEDVHYQLAPYDKRGALALQVYGAEGTLEFQVPLSTSELFILGTSGNGDSHVNVRLNYTDGSQSDAGMFTIRDWSVRDYALRGDEAVTALGNIRRDNNTFSSDNHYCMFDFSVPVDEDRLLESVTITNTSLGFASILAFSAIKQKTDGIDLAAYPTSDSFHQSSPAIFNMGGMQLSNSRRGLNIVRRQDGTVRKVMRR